MNYRHIYHAGIPSDVVKHSILALILEHLAEKDKPFAYLDTHAGGGLYDLSDPRAQKTDEAATGIRKLWARRAACPPELRPYLEILDGLNPDGALRWYPGSPFVAAKRMRAQDRLVLCELHPEEAAGLRRSFRDDPRAQVHHRDGYEALRGLLPFPEKRGLVLIDPPFEKTDEFDFLARAAKTIVGKMPQAVVAIWYPVKDRPAIWRFHESLRAASLPSTTVAEFIYFPETRSDRLNGSGMILVNAPWKLPERMAALFPALHDLLETEEKGSVIRELTA